jgi:cyclic pyranopterin phosphate synthase
MELSHIDKRGNAVMVDVSPKKPLLRKAVATGTLSLAPATVKKIRRGSMGKGDVLAAARIAGIVAAKKTSELIPLCHNLPLDKVSVDLALAEDHIAISATAVCTGKTGVEMEALIAVSIAALTIYDMCKAVDKTMAITKIALLKKTKETPP